MNREQIEHENAGVTWPIVGFITLLGCFWLVAKHFDVTIRLYTGVSFIILLVPYWAFGFGLDRWLRRNLKGRAAVTLAPLFLIASYLVFALPRNQFRWNICLGMTAIVLSITLLLQRGSTDGAPLAMPGWQDWLVLAILGIAVDLRFFDRAWPVAGLTGMPKLLFVDAGLYGYLVIR